MDVAKVQNRLNQLGFKIAVDGINGDNTRNAVQAFQSQNGLDADGIVGPLTLAKLFPLSPIGSQAIKTGTTIKPYTVTGQTVQERAMQIALSQNGVREAAGANDGPAVETYLKSVGLGKGNSWCMAFVYWCYEQAARELNAANPLFKTGHCLTQWNKTECKKEDAPHVGDIFIMVTNPKTASGHTGIVTKVNGDGTVETIEGNTNDNGSSNGDGVYIRKNRKISSFKGLINCSR